MSTASLPRVLDFRKAAAREASLSGSLRPADLPRLRAMLAGDGGDLQVRAGFRRDDQGRSIVDLEVEARLELRCQRCLGNFEHALASASQVAAVFTDEQARQLPAPLEPAIVVDEVDLWDLAEEELVLAVPAFPCHEDSACLRDLAGDLQAGSGAEPDMPARENPFKVLSRLKEDSDQQTGE
jgi:uncharacterized protein